MGRYISEPAALPPPKKLAVEQIAHGIARIDERISQLRSFDIREVPEGESPTLAALSVAIQDTLDRCFGAGTLAFRRFEKAADLSWSAGVWIGDYPQRHHYQEGVRKHIERAIALLEEAKRVLSEDLKDQEYNSPQRIPLSKPLTLSRKVFVVHGHDAEAKQELARFLEKLGLEAIILHEKPDQGRTIIEKFEEYADQVGFAIILFTPDDFGGSKSNFSQVARARQNVVFELGYFVGKMGRGKTCIIRKGEVEIPSDLFGVIYTEWDAGEGWKIKLVKELKAANMAFDANKLWV